MHVVFQTHNGGELWLGGIAAAGNIATLLDNGITGILSAASSPPVVKDHRLTDYGTLDGTGLMTNWSQLKERARSLTVRILEDVLNGKKVLVSCRNGAHRSATEMAMLLMALSRVSADEVHNYLRNLRNIVVLESFHPSQTSKQDIPKPIVFLRQKREEILAFWAGRPNMSLMDAMPPAAFADLADTAGLERVGQDRVWNFCFWGFRMFCFHRRFFSLYLSEYLIDTSRVEFNIKASQLKAKPLLSLKESINALRPKSRARGPRPVPRSIFSTLN